MESEAGPSGANSPRKQQQSGDRFITIGKLIDASRANIVQLSIDVHPCADLARIVLDRGKRFAEEKYEHGSDGLVRIALRGRPNAQSEGDKCAMGGSLPTSRTGRRRYEVARWKYLPLLERRLPQFKGIIPVSTMQRCAEFSSRVEESLWCIGKTRTSLSELDIYTALGNLFRAITEAEHRCAGAVGSSKSDGAGDQSRGIKRKLPMEIAKSV